MNDDRIEELLRDSWQPEPPENMRGRVLARSHEEMARRTRIDWRWMLGWKPALAALGIAIVLFANIDDNRREARITAMAGGSGKTISPAPSSDYFRMQREMNDMLARAPFDGCSTGQIENGGGYE